MLCFNRKQSAQSLVAVLMIGATVLSSVTTVSAKPLFSGKSSNTYNSSTQPYPPNYNNYPRQYSQTGIIIPSGTAIPVSYDDAETITIAKGESLSLNLNVAANIRQADGTILIPAGSEISGQLQATDQGVQYLAQQIVLPNGRSIPINATSRMLVDFQTENEGASAADIIMGTLAGAGTATLIAGTTGDRHINALEVLAGAATGALAGWGLPTAGIVGGGTREVMTIDPSQDLTLTLQSPLSMNSNASGYSRYNNNPAYSSYNSFNSYNSRRIAN